MITDIPLFLLYDNKKVCCDRKRADETMRPEKYLLVQVQEAISRPLEQHSTLIYVSDEKQSW